MKTIGLDLSLTSTGLVLMDTTGVIEMENVKSSGKKGDGYAEFLTRIDFLHTRVQDWVRYVSVTGKPSLAVIESPSHGSKFGNPHERAGLWWDVYRTLTQRGIPVATVAPATRAKYITGNGRADKKEVLAAARVLYGDDLPNDDVADAAGLAAMGMRRLGFPVEAALPLDQVKCMEAAKWPDVRSVA